MKRNAAGDFCVLYVEAGDGKAAILDAIVEQKKPIVIMLAEQARVFQRPEDFTDLKHLKRRLDLPIVFVIPQSEHLTLLAGRHGFPVYLSMDALADAVAVGQLARQRTLNRTTTPLAPFASGPLPGHLGAGPSIAIAPTLSPKKTVPLTSPITPTPPPGLDTLQPLPKIRSTNVKTDTLPLHASRPLPGNGANSTRYAAQAAPEWHTIPTVPLAHPTPKPLPLPTAPLARPTLKLLSLPTALFAQPARRRLLIVLLVVLLVLTLIGAGIGSIFAFFPQTAASTPAALPIVGHVSFLSSEQVSENSDQGIDDEVLIDLTNIPDPAPQKNYYAWLLSDLSQGDTMTLLLGTLHVSQGKAHLLYTGDAQHTNLLAIASRFLVTQEDGAVLPVAPSPDYTTWRYYAAFAQSATATTGSDMSGMGAMAQYSFLDHLRHLLASDPMLNQLELPGGLNTWLYRNTGKVVGWTGSMPDSWQESKDVASIRSQTLRTLTYLDGLSFVKEDLPAQMQLDVSEHLASVGLLSVNGANQTPSSYLDSINFHLSGLLQTAPKEVNLRSSAAGVVDALSNVRYWLEMVRQDARQILAMSDAQLLQPTTLTLLNDMMNNATYAYVGQSDPSTGMMREGVVWIYHQMQSFATLDVTAYTAHSSSMQLVPGGKPPMTERIALPGRGGNS